MDVLYCGYVVLNGLLFSFTGRQMKLRGQTESCQTKFGMRRALKRLGFEDVRVEQGRFFVAQGSKSAM
jgi:hypothetical protein